MNARRFVLCLALLVSAAGLTSAQDPLPDLFQESIEVRVVNIEVVVTDAAGQRVRGLRAEDFVLEVDTQQEPIGFFSEIRDGIAAPSLGDLSAPPGTQPGQQVATNFLIFVDDSLTTERDRNLVLEKLSEQVLARGLGDRVAMVAFDGTRLETLTGWTQDRFAFDSAIDRALARPAYGMQAAGDLRMMDEWARDREFHETNQETMMAEAASSAAGPGGAGGAEDANGGAGSLSEANFDREPGEDILTGFLSGPDLATAQMLTDTVRNGVSATVHALRSSAPPPGRKVMILLLGSWPMSPASYVANRFGDSLRDVAAANIEAKYNESKGLFDPLTETANLLGYSLYPVDVAGQVRRLSWDASDSPNQFEQADFTSGAGNATDREEGVHAAFQHLAGATGGLAMINAERTDAFDQTWQDTRSFYWLGFTPQRAGDNAEHQVRVSVRGRPDLVVRTRNSFVDRSRQAEHSMAIESALLFDRVTRAGAPVLPGQLAVQYGAPAKTSGRKMTVKAEVGIPMDAITLLQREGRWVNQLEVRFLAMDLNGNRSEVALGHIPINGGAPPAPGQRLWYQTDLLMKRRDHRIVVTVYDPLGGATMAHSFELEEKK